MCIYLKNAEQYNLNRKKTQQVFKHRKWFHKSSRHRELGIPGTGMSSRINVLKDELVN
jgi:hypothetical protein